MTTAPPAPMICQRENAPGSMVQPKVMMPEAGNGGRAVIVGATGGVVSTTNARVACAPGCPKGVIWLTRKVYAPSASDGNVHSVCGPLNGPRTGDARPGIVRSHENVLPARPGPAEGG